MPFEASQNANNTLEKRIDAVWARYFHCDMANLAQPGTNLVLNENQRGSQQIDLWYINQRTFIRIAPEFERPMRDMLMRQPETKAWRAAEIITTWGEARATLSHTLEICFLQPDVFQPVIPPPSCTCRQLSLTDKPFLDTMQKACTNDDLDEADIAIDHEVVFGCFQGEQLVAVSSMYTIRGGFADIGVLTHPDFRGRGLGKAVVSALCNYLLPQDRLVVYRYVVTNIGSARIAKALGFWLYHTQESVQFNDEISRVYPP